MAQLFAVMLDSADEEVLGRAKNLYEPTGDYFPVSETTVMIRSAKLAPAIRDELGIGGQAATADTCGIVISLNGGFAGFFDPRVWDWIKGQKVFHE